MKPKRTAKTTDTTPALYGIHHSTRNFADPYYWGKNQFNSSFPVALCCYMRDKKYGAVRISQSGTDTKTKEVNINEVFGTRLPNSALKFCFESKFTPFSKYVEDEIVPIDLVITNFVTGEFIQPLEIKLTTLPDDGTSSFSEDQYGSEIVVRPATMRYLALNIARRCTRKDREQIRSIFNETCKNIQDWRNQAEMIGKRAALLADINKFLIRFEAFQRPLLVQPIWKTKGKKPILADNCLDVFAWTDFALARCLYNVSVSSRKHEIIRPQRALLRLARFLYEFAKSGKVFQSPIYDGMTFEKQSDKEFALNGHITHKYMACDRLTKPKVRKSEIKNIILGGGQKYLSPERRFDAILFFSKDIFED